MIQLYGGRLVDHRSLTIDDIDIEAIAHSLSNQCRYLGHTAWHYSVAQHSVYVSHLVPTLCALLHDAPEAILIDIPRLVKQQKEFEGYRELEKLVWSVIVEKYGLPSIIPDSVHIADKVMLWYEANQLMRNKDSTLNVH